MRRIAKDGSARRIAAAVVAVVESIRDGVLPCCAGEADLVNNEGVRCVGSENAGIHAAAVIGTSARRRSTAMERSPKCQHGAAAKEQDGEERADHRPPARLYTQMRPQAPKNATL